MFFFFFLFFIFLPFSAFSLAPERTQKNGILMGCCFHCFFYKFRKLKESKFLLRVLLGFLLFSFAFFFFKHIFFKLCGLDFFCNPCRRQWKNLSYLLMASMEQKFAKPVKTHESLLQCFNHSCNIFEYMFFCFPAIFVQQKCLVEVFPLLKSSSDTEIMHCISGFHIHFDVLKGSE